MKKSIGIASLILGVMLIAISVYQINQYITVSATLNYQLSALKGVSTTSLTQTQVTQLQATQDVANLTNTALIEGILIDVALGVVFAAIGVFLLNDTKSFK
jgi:hypothetical protein